MGTTVAHDHRLPFQRRHLPEDLGPRLQEAREGRALSRRMAAAGAGIRPRTLARIERGAQKPTWTTLDRLCETLSVSVFTFARRWGSDSLDRPESVEAAPGLGLRALRLERGFTLTGLASASGVSAATLSRFERGLTASTRLSARVDDLDAPWDERDLILENDRVSAAFGFADSAALRHGCAEAWMRRADLG